MPRPFLPAARDELHRMLNEDELRESILLVFANKQDLPNAMSAAEMTDKLGLHGLRQRQWYARTHVACHYYTYTAISLSLSALPEPIHLQYELQIFLTTSPHILSQVHPSVLRNDRGRTL